MTAPFPFETERHQDEVPPSSVHPTDFYSLTDPALDVDNNVQAGKRWRKVDSLAAPTWFEIYIRNQANSAWIKEQAWVIADYSLGDVPVADANGRLAPGSVEGGESGPGGTGELIVAAEGTPVGTRPELNFIEGSNVTITVTDNVGQDRVDVEIAATSGGGGGLVFLSRVVASASASLPFTSLLTATYDRYEIHFADLVPGTDDVTLNLEFSTDNGSTWASAAYWYVNYIGTDTGFYGNEQSGSAAAYKLCGNAGSGTGENVSGTLVLLNPLGALYKAVKTDITQHNSGSAAAINYVGSGGLKVTTACNAVRLIMSSGTVASGYATLYGVQKS